MPSYPPTVPAAPAPHVVQQPAAKSGMNMQSPAESTQEQQNEALRLRGGCPGHFCGLPILPCRVNICIFPIPCC